MDSVDSSKEHVSPVVEIFPEEVLELLSVELGQDKRDQYGLQWYKPRHNPLDHIGVIAGTLLGTGKKKMERAMWPAILKSMIDPVLQYLTGRMGPRKNPRGRITGTRRFFETAIRGLFGSGDARVRKEVQRVNKAHEHYGVFDARTGEVYPEQWRSFAFVSHLVTQQMKGAFAQNPITREMRSAIENLWGSTSQKIGLPLYPKDNEEFLRKHREIVEQCRQIFRKKNPELLASMDRDARRIACATQMILCHDKGISSEEFWNMFDEYEQSILQPKNEEEEEELEPTRKRILEALKAGHSPSPTDVVSGN